MSQCGKHRCKESQKLVLSAHVRCSAASLFLVTLGRKYIFSISHKWDQS